jgi:hypothetical protein
MRFVVAIAVSIIICVSGLVAGFFAGMWFYGEGGALIVDGKLWAQSQRSELALCNFTLSRLPESMPLTGPNSVPLGNFTTGGGSGFTNGPGSAVTGNQSPAVTFNGPSGSTFNSSSPSNFSNSVPPGSSGSTLGGCQRWTDLGRVIVVWPR